MKEDMQKSVLRLQKQAKVEDEVAPKEKRKRKPMQFSDKNHETQLKAITATWPEILAVLIKHGYQDSIKLPVGL